jgi:hypothetical protein
VLLYGLPEPDAARSADPGARAQSFSGRPQIQSSGGVLALALSTAPLPFASRARPHCADSTVVGDAEAPVLAVVLKGERDGELLLRLTAISFYDSEALWR